MKRPIINSISTKVQLYNKETIAMEWLVKIGFPYNTLAIRQQRHNRPYIRSQDRTSTLTSFMENLIFSPLSAYSPTLKANTDSIMPPNSE